ncbi:MAG: hypothetical protein E7013_04590 [Alphaproteobacteria bacterium]|nr:hypothetical protein [Alphaproteobacteria bacterium]
MSSLDGLNNKILKFDMSTIIGSLLLMEQSERIKKLNEFVNEYPKQTFAQKIYEMIYKIEQKKELEALNAGLLYTFNPLITGINNTFNHKEVAEEFRQILIKQRRERQEEIKKEKLERSPFVYHISNISPDEIEGCCLRPREQLEHFRDQGAVNAVFASSDNNWAMSLKIGRGVSTSVSSSSFSNEKTVIVSDKDKFLDFKSQHPYSYQYAFPIELFEPNVGYNGVFTGEWYALDKEIKIDKKHCEKMSVDEVISSGVNLYFVCEKTQYTTVHSKLKEKQPIEELIKEGLLIPYKIGDLERYRVGQSTLSKILSNFTLHR